MYDSYETISESVVDGWNVTIDLAPDYDYRPGEDDDCYPILESVPRYFDDSGRDYDGRFVRQPIIVWGQNDRYMVSLDTIDHLIEVGGMNPRTARKTIESDAEAIASGDLSWTVVRVTAKRDSVEGTAYLGGVEYDLRQVNADRYALETADEYGMIGEAIEDAIVSLMGQSMATMVISY